MSSGASWYKHDERWNWRNNLFEYGANKYKKLEWNGSYKLFEVLNNMALIYSLIVGLSNSFGNYFGNKPIISAIISIVTNSWAILSKVSVTGRRSKASCVIKRAAVSPSHSQKAVVRQSCKNEF